jgi:hypothetical protein
MIKVKCGECERWDRENIKKIERQRGGRDDIAFCLVALDPPCFEYRDREIECGDFKEVEPEIYEVECEPSMHVLCGYLTGTEKPQYVAVHVGEKFASKIIGKRTKAIFEVKK